MPQRKVFYKPHSTKSHTEETKRLCSICCSKKDKCERKMRKGTCEEYLVELYLEPCFKDYHTENDCVINAYNK